MGTGKGMRWLGWNGRRPTLIPHGPEPTAHGAHRREGASYAGCGCSVGLFGEGVWACVRSRLQQTSSLRAQRGWLPLTQRTPLGYHSAKSSGPSASPPPPSLRLSGLFVFHEGLMNCPAAKWQSGAVSVAATHSNHARMEPETRIGSRMAGPATRNPPAAV
jgi:hypothetical protein